MGGDEGQWVRWVDMHGKALVAYARQWTRNHTDAEDIVQDAFLRFWRTRSSVRDPLAYLYVCIRRRACDFLQTRQRQASSLNEGEKPHVEIFDHCPLELRETKAAVERTLDRLSIEKREVLILKIWGNLTFKQISEIVSISPNTAASRYRYALDALKEQLSSETVS
jgi:RNA polymerase sigma-70 factor (ECF subfamily)